MHTSVHKSQSVAQHPLVIIKCAVSICLRYLFFFSNLKGNAIQKILGDFQQFKGSSFGQFKGNIDNSLQIRGSDFVLGILPQINLNFNT